MPSQMSCRFHEGKRRCGLAGANPGRSSTYMASDHSPSACSHVSPVRASRFATPVTLLTVQSFRNWPSLDGPGRRIKREVLRVRAAEHREELRLAEVRVERVEVAKHEQRSVGTRP